MPQLLIDGRGLQAVDLVHGGDRIVGERAKDVARAGVVRGDYTVLPRHGVPHLIKLVVGQDIQVGRPQLDVVLRIEEVVPRGSGVLALRAPVSVAAAAHRHELHEAVGRHRTDGKGVEVALRADDGEHEAGADLVPLGEPAHHRPVFLRLLVGEVRDHGHLDEVRRL